MAGGREDLLLKSDFTYQSRSRQISDMQNDSPLNPIDYFRLKSTQTESRKSAGNMRRAIESLSDFAGGTDLSFDSFDAAFLGEWIAAQFFDGYQSATVAYNLSKIAALYNKAVAEGLAAPAEIFSGLPDKIISAAPAFDGVDHVATFQKIRTICLADYSSAPAKDLARDIIIYGIFNGGMTLSRLAKLKKDDYTGDDPHILKIVGKYAKPKNKYLFPLNQAHLTPRQLALFMQELTGNLLKSVGIQRRSLPDLALADIWCDLAMSCGVPASDIAACVDSPEKISPLTFCASPSSPSPDKIAEIRRQVSDTLADNPIHWYAMHLRQHTQFQDLTDRLKDRDLSLDEIFYPMEEIIRKVGKKKVFENRPVISWLIFYRARVTQLNRLFHEIGDLAWGYRYLRDVKSPYAVISDREVRNYQQAIGTLSPAVRMLEDNDVKFEEGDCLVLLGGPMNGRHGVFIAEKKVKGDASGRVVFRIRLAGGNNINWEVNWDPALVKKITEDQYRELDRKASSPSPPTGTKAQ